MGMDEENNKCICRVCLIPVNNKSLSLFDEYSDSVIFEHINTITNVNISRDEDGLPDRICPDCLLDLITAVNFKKKCESANVVLRTSLLHPHPVPVETGCTDMAVKDDYQDVEYLEDTHFSDAEYNADVMETKSEVHFETDYKSKVTDRKLQCNDCGRFFKSKCKLSAHWKRFHLPKKLICKTCKRTFKSHAAFQRHEKVKTQSCTKASDYRIEGEGKNRTFFCKQCAYYSHKMKYMITHSVVHTGDRLYECDICGKTYTQQCSLQAHKESAHEQYLLQISCQFCGKLILGRVKYYDHLKTHKVKNFSCSICNKLLKSKFSLAVHMRRHTGVKSFTCEKCARTFFSLAELCNHKRTVHDKGKYWYKCDICDYKAVRNNVVKKHKAKHTGSNIPCTICGMFFESTQKLVLHQRRHFEEKKFECPHCDSRFLRRSSIHKHILVKHVYTVTSIEDPQLSVKQEAESLVQEMSSEDDYDCPNNIVIS